MFAMQTLAQPPILIVPGHLPQSQERPGTERGVVELIPECEAQPAQGLGGVLRLVDKPRFARQVVRAQHQQRVLCAHIILAPFSRLGLATNRIERPKVIKHWPAVVEVVRHLDRVVDRYQHQLLRGRITLGREPPRHDPADRRPAGKHSLFLRPEPSGDRRPPARDGEDARGRIERAAAVPDGFVVPLSQLSQRLSIASAHLAAAHATARLGGPGDRPSGYFPSLAGTFSPSARSRLGSALRCPGGPVINSKSPA